jgi:hypothetical protein
VLQVLWDVLPASVMDAALTLHNTCMRGLLLAHQG